MARCRPVLPSSDQGLCTNLQAADLPAGEGRSLRMDSSAGSSFRENEGNLKQRHSDVAPESGRTHVC